MKFYCTKYAATEGILEFEGETSQGASGTLYCHSTGNGLCALSLKPGEFFATLDAAQKDALNRLAKNIEKAKKAVEKAQKKLAKACVDEGVQVRQWNTKQGTVK